MKLVRTLSLFFFLAASAFLVSCAATTDPTYDNPTKLEQQSSLQEIHGDILRQSY